MWMYPEEAVWMEEGCSSHLAILKPQNVLCFMTLNGFQKCGL